MRRRRRWSRGVSSVATLAFVILVLAGGWRMAMAVNAAQPDAAAELARAWQRAQAAGSYRFTADIVQQVRPAATVENIGRQSRQDTLYVEGQTALGEQTMEMTLWSQGGSVADASGGVQMRVEGDQAFVRQGEEPWQAVDDFTGLFAPQGDFMTYLTAVGDVVDLGRESRAGLTFNRYGFNIDGPAYAAHVRDQLQAQLAQKGELPPGVKLDLPAQYAAMTGNGELWVGADGLPLRQILSLQLAGQNGDDISASVTVNFSHYGVGRVGAGAGARAGLQWEAVQAALLKWLPPLSTTVAMLGLFWILLQKRSRTITSATMLTIVASMLFSPIMHSAGVVAFSERQAARARQEAEREQESEMQRALQGMGNKSQYLPEGALTLLRQDNRSDADYDGLTDVEEQLLGTAFVGAAFEQTNAIAMALPENDGADRDGDGLSDYAEALLGTLPDFADSDGDGVSDRVELEGFSYNGQMWYGDPLAIDSNGDGIDDGREWLLDLDGNGIPDDGDGDGVPDLFDDDNDGDGVPDDVDLSPYSQLSQVFGDDSPLELSLDNLGRDRITYVEFQLRPTNPDHLWFAYNVLDWPDNDRQGTMQDADGGTFADVDAGLPAAPNANGDLRLVPMLELTMPGATTHLPDSAILANYGIAVQPLPDDHVAVYVPLQLSQDAQGGANVAFYGKMIYRPQSDEWGNVHQVRLVWAVQALVDICAEFSGGQCSRYTDYNQVQVIHTYDDAWRLTGMNVRENHVSDMALVYEDPTLDDDHQDDTPLWQLSHGLEATFLAGRTAPGSVGTPQRDVSASGIFHRFNHATNNNITPDERWGIRDTLSVDFGSYSHLDEAMMSTAITATKRVLDSAFTPSWSASQPITPTLLYAREDVYRSFNLDELIGANAHLLRVDGGQLSFNLQPDIVKVTTLASVNWAPFQYNGSAWSGMAIEHYWDELARRHHTEFEAAYPEAEVAGGALGLAQIYYVSLYRGIVNVVQTGDLILQHHYFTSDKPLAARVAGAGQSGAMFITRILASNLIAPSQAMRWIDSMLRNYSTYKWGNPLSTIGSRLADLFQDFYFWYQTSSLKFGLAMAATVAVVAAVGVGAYFLVQAYLSDAPGARIAVAVVVGAITAYFGVIAPILAARDMVRLVTSTTGVSTATAVRSVAVASGQINTAGRIAGAVGLIIAVGVVWGIFMYAIFSSNVPPGSVAFNMMLAQAIAATIVAILMFVVSLTIVGAIIVGIISVLDLVLTLLGVGFTVSGWVTETIARSIYHFQLTIDSDVQTGAFDLALSDPARGLVAGNMARVSLPITTTIVHTDPEPRVVLLIDHFYTANKLRTTTFAYELNEGPGDLSVGRTEMPWGWSVMPDRSFNTGIYGDYTLHRAANYANPSLNVTLREGVNISLPVNLTSAYALPGVECWTILFAFDCSDRTIDGSNDLAVGEALVLDVLPATLGEFYALQWGGGTPFAVQRDHDGDGLISRAYGGIDPDDSVNQCHGGPCWDTDGDGLSDRYELELRALGVANGGARLSPLAADSDADGLCDDDEIRLGTRPDKRDSDGDGLLDGEEVWHQDRCDYNGNGDTEEWLGGWDFTTTYIDAAGANRTVVTRISSNPLLADEDGDGMSDLAEMTLHQLDAQAYAFHPAVFNESPLALYVAIDDEDGIVSPGQPVAITTTVQNNLSTPLYAMGGVTVTLPGVLGGGVISDTYNLYQGYRASTVTSATVLPSGTITATVEGIFAARLHDGNTASTWAWEPPRQSEEKVLAGIYPRQATLAALVGADYDYAIASLESTLPGDAGAAGITYGDAQARLAVATIGDGLALNPAASGVAGDHAAAIASNNAGESLAVWSNAHWYGCADVELIQLSVITQGDQSGGSEYYMVRTNVANSTDVNRTFGDAYSSDGTRLWADAEGDRRNGAQIPIGVTRMLCEGDTIGVWEDDGDGLLSDDFVCTFFPFGHPMLIDQQQTIDCSDGANTYLQLDFRVIPDASHDWLGRGNETCAQVALSRLDVLNATDQSGGAEYYINRNGHHTVSPGSIGGSNPAAGTRIWTAVGSANGGDTLQLGVTATVCRGDTLDIWEDDGGSGDDYVCSLPMLADTPPTAQSQGSPITVACSGFDSDPTELRLHYTVTPNPKHTIAAAIVDAEGVIKRDGLLLQGEMVDYRSGFATYRPYGRPVVASDGRDFLVVWTDDLGRTQMRPVSADGDAGAVVISGGAGDAPGNLDLVWAGTHYILAYEAGGNVELRLVNEDASSRGSVVIANSSLREYGPKVAYNPVAQEALVVYVVRINATTYSVRGRLRQGSGLSPEFVIGSVATDPSATDFFEPGVAVAHDSTHESWLVAWNYFNATTGTAEIHYQSLSASGAPLLPEETVVIESGMNAEHLSLACSDPNVIAPNCALLTHSSAQAAQQQLRLDRVFLRNIPPWLGEIEGTAAVALVVDGDAPTSSISLENNQTLRIPDMQIIGGNADDLTSNVAFVEVSINGGPWQRAEGAESWVFAWTPGGSGAYTIRTRATDVTGNVEAPAAGVTVNVDNDAPQLSAGVVDNAILGAEQDAQGRWRVTLDGAAVDAAGVRAVETLVTPNGSGWQPATLSGSAWQVDYALAPASADGAALTEATGDYTLWVRATDGAGNQTADVDLLAVPFRVDTSPPVVDLQLPGAAVTVITQTLTLSGAVTEPGGVAAGVQGVEIDFVPAGSGASSHAWASATLSGSGPGVGTTAWQFDVPAELEGNYLINLRGSDVLGNREDDQGNWWSGWQGEIDTRAPRAVITTTVEGAGEATRTHVAAWIQDLNLTEEGLDFICDVQNKDRTTRPHALDPETERLVALRPACTVNGLLSEPVSLRVVDLFGRETVVTAEPPTVAEAPLASTVLTPSHEGALGATDAVTITGGAYAVDALKSLTLRANGLEIYATSWASTTLTNTVWSTSWTPPAEGVYELVSEVEDWSGAVQTALQPTLITVDTQPPVIGFDAAVLTTTQRLSYGRVALTGTVSDSMGVEQIVISVDGERVGYASFDESSWRYHWDLGADVDGGIYEVTAEARDAAHTSSSVQAVTVDLSAPSPVTTTLAVVNTAGQTVPIAPGDTVRDGSTLLLDWTASVDGSGIAAYHAGWHNSLTPTLAALTAYGPDERHHEVTVSEASAWLAHVVTLDELGNATPQTVGPPVYVDGPLTPDYIGTDDGLGAIYRGWMDSGCTQIGANRELARNAAGDGTVNEADVQKMYFTWDAANLRMAWTGADWDVDGDLFIYLDTQSGGATAAYNPYESPMTIHLPPGMGADYVVYVEDAATAHLLRWDGDAWQEARALPAPNYLMDAHLQPAITDLYLPLQWLGSPSSLGLLALASEEDALRVWAAMPDKNPLNSQQAVSTVASPYLHLDYTLTQQYAWSALGAAGVCPAQGQFEDADLHVTLTSDPPGVQVGFLEHDLAGLTPPGVRLDGDLDGAPDVAGLPLDDNPAAIGQGQTVAYTLHIANEGAASASGIVVDLATYGGLALSGGSQRIEVGTLAAGESTGVTFNATVNSALHGASGEIAVVVSDAVHGPFDWLWVQHDIDTVGPEHVDIVAPLSYIGPFTTTIRGVVSDRSPVPSISLQAVGGATQSCVDATPENGEWACIWDAGGAADGTVFQLRAQGSDVWGNSGAFGLPRTLTVDAVPPSISLSAATQSALADERLGPGESGLRGAVVDDRAAAQAEVCALESGSATPICMLVNVNSGAASQGSWFAPAPLDGSLDGAPVTLSFVAIDSAGNRSLPLTRTLQVDLQAPRIELTTYMPVVAQHATVTALAGTVVDGSGVAAVELRVTGPDGSLAIVPATLNGDAWHYDARFEKVGRTLVGVEALDTFGNRQVLGTFTVDVIAAGVNVPPVVNMAPGYVVEEGGVIEIDSHASDVNGDALTYAWDLNDDGEYDDASTASVIFDATNIDGPSSHVLRVRVTDGLSDAVTGSTTVTVVTSPPRNIVLDLSAAAIGENETLSLNGSFAGSVFSAHAVMIDWGDGTIETLELGANTSTFGPLQHTYVDDNPSGTREDAMRVTVTVTDDEGDSGHATASLTVQNAPPVLSNVSVADSDENNITTLTGSIADPGPEDHFTLTVVWGDGSPPEIFNYAAGTTAFSEVHRYLDDNPAGTPSDAYTVHVTLVDDDNGRAEASTTATVNNAPPLVIAGPLTQTAQVSDYVSPIMITATDTISDPLTIGMAWRVDGAPDLTAGLPVSLTFGEGPCVAGGAYAHDCAWTISGVAQVAAGRYEIVATVADDDTGQAAVTGVLALAPEDALVTFDESNPLAVAVIEAGSDASEPFSLRLRVQEAPESGPAAAPGDINLAEVWVTLEPLGTGPTITAPCVATSSAPPHRYDAILEVQCDFDAIPVNVYTARAQVDGGYYSGAGEQVLTVYDPSLGFITGGAWLYWPGTLHPESGYMGDRTEINLNFRYNRNNIVHKMVVIRYGPDGTSYRLESDTLHGVALGSDDNSNVKWAAISGTATYRQSGWQQPASNYSYLLYLEDRGQPGSRGGADRVWLQVRDEDGNLVANLSMEAPAIENSFPTGGGNIVVH